MRNTATKSTTATNQLATTGTVVQENADQPAEVSAPKHVSYTHSMDVRGREAPAAEKPTACPFLDSRKVKPAQLEAWAKWQHKNPVYSGY